MDVAEEPVLQVFRRKVSRGSRSAWKSYCWRVAVLALVFLGILCASVVKLARASSYKSHPIVCDGVDDDSDASVACGLPEDTSKKLSLTNVKALPSRKLSPSAFIFPHRLQLQPHQYPSPDSSLRSRHLPTQRAASPEDPDGAH